jgi:hypothetical protein
LFLVSVSEQCGTSWCGILIEQRVFLYVSARKCQRKFRRKFHDEIIPSRQTIHNLMNKLGTTGPLIGKEQKQKRRVLAEKLHMLHEHRPRKSLKHLAQETGVSKSSARRNVTSVF